MNNTKQAFCANCQKTTAHRATIDANQELVLTCDCGRFIKLPTEGMTAADVEAYLAAHEQANQGQVSVAAQEAQNDQLLSELLD